MSFFIGVNLMTTDRKTQLTEIGKRLTAKWDEENPKAPQGEKSAYYHGILDFYNELVRLQNGE